MNNPSVDECAQGFERILDKINPKQMKMLRAHYHSNGRAATMRELATAAGYADYKMANLQYGNLAKRLYQAMGYPKPRSPRSGNEYWILGLGHFVGRQDLGLEMLCIMRHEIAESLGRLGIVELSEMGHNEMANAETDLLIAEGATEIPSQEPEIVPITDRDKASESDRLDFTSMKHIVLLGDSIFDSKDDFWKFWVKNKGISNNLREQMPTEWTATLLAVDGKVTDDFADQLANVPTGATHLFVSAGRYDALREMDILDMPASSGAHVLNELSNRVKAFEWRYSQMLDDVLALNKPTAVCTAYIPRGEKLKFFDAKWMKLSAVVVSAFNDVIIRHALIRGLPLIDLRYVCDEYDGDLASAQIAEQIVHVVNECDFSRKRTEIFANEVPAAERIKGFTGVPLLLTAEERNNHKITKEEIEAGKQGSSQIAALLTVRPEDWSEDQKWKADKLRELDFREREIFGFMEIERIQNKIGAAL